MASKMGNGTMNVISVGRIAVAVFGVLVAWGVAMALIHALPALAQEPGADPLAGFTLVDASDQSELATLTDGASVELADPDGGSYGIRANLADGESVGSVSLELSGAKSVGPRTENLAPYSLYGDHRSGATRHLDGESLPAGSYTLTATAYANSNLGGDELGTLEVSFTIAQTNRAPVFGSATYNFSVAEDTATGTAVGTVSATDADSDDSLTYTIESGNGGGKFAIDGSSGAVTTAGTLDHETTPSYTLTVQADDGNGGTATATVNVSVTDVAETLPGPLAGFTLVDASDQAVLASLTAGLSVELADPNGGSYGIRADVDDGETVGSVELSLTGAKTVSQTENVAPYSLYGDGGADALDGGSLPAGSYTLTATAYADGNLAGDELGTLEVSFTVAAPAPSPSDPGFQHGTTADGVPYIRFADASDTGTPAGGLVAGSAGGDTITVNPTTTTQYLLPQGLWSDETTLWVSARGASMDADERLYAYTLATGARDSGKDIALAVPDNLPDPGNPNDQRDGATGIWMTSDTIWASAGLIDDVLAYHRTADTNDPSQFAAGDRKSGSDIDALPSDALTPVGLWSDGTDMYIADYSRGRIYVHRLSDQAHVKTLRTTDGNRNPVGLWSDGTTLWVGDSHDEKVYAYTLSDWSRNPDLDLNTLSSENGRPQGIWSDGSKLWVADKHSDKVFIYNLPGGARLASLEVSDVNLDAFSPNVAGYARNVAGNVTSVTVSAETVRDGATVAITPADADSNSSNGHQVTLVTNGETTITVTVTHGSDTKVYTLTLTQLENTTKPLSSDATLSALTLSGIALSPSFDSDTTLYRSTMTASQFANGITTTVEATKNNTNAELDISPDDGDGNTMGHQVVTEGGAVTVEITVTAQDGSETRTYTVHIGAITRDPAKDMPSDIERPRFPHDIWSDGETMWVVQPVGGVRLYAFNLRTGARTSALDYRNWNNAYYEAGLWSDGDTIWFSEIYNGSSTGAAMINAIDAQSHSPAVYIAEQSFVTPDEAKAYAPPCCAAPRGLWSDGETIWVAFVDEGAYDEGYVTTLAGGGLKAYDFSTKARKSTADISIQTAGKAEVPAREPMSFGIWSDGTILWVVSNYADNRSKLEAHKLADGSRVPSMDIPVGEDELTRPRGMWSDGRTMWVLNIQFYDANFDHGRRIYAYTLPPNAKLFSLEMSDVDFGHFIHGRPKYTATVGSSVDETTVSWEQAHTGGSAAVAISAVNSDGTSTTDADMKEGYQVSLAEGENVITITVTAPNGTDTYAYTVTVTRAPS